ncbi:Hsp20/alpha crystallin family protein [Candidatus Minimicrobia vallesae]|uniref:Hsp20/alpha crystallin family protein n=1 Tax=Candidatus Minimicrobia vallesae TaxID=2841264 RepID=A0A8F1SAC6_9BACT|nr:Hsp20/alpha crystallin family protein [Candidatus Minimicrobia vallesae]QWQ31448.1 Hsp20/alpha crystallin family protein [Candidatus Minimicrobia vallesae]
MARKQDDTLLTEQELAAAFIDDDNDDLLPGFNDDNSRSNSTPATRSDDNWEDEADDAMGQLAVDVFETENNLVIKARTAGVDRNDLDVSISDGILTISGTLSSGDEADVRQWHIQECYWGEFSRTLALPTAVNEEGVKAELKDGVLTITFEKIKQEKSKEDSSSVKTISQKIPSQVGGIFLAIKKEPHQRGSFLSLGRIMILM